MKFVKGFMGKTHALLSIMLFCICMLIPVDFFQTTIGIMKNETLFFIAGIVVLVGGALLPDLDNAQSAAGATLGPLGSICTTFMQSTSSICWTFLHGKGDKMPPTQHRYLWHTFIIGAGIFCLFFFGMPKGEDTIIASIKVAEDFLTWLQGNAVIVFFVILLFMAILVGSNMLFSKIISVFKIRFLKLINYIFPVLMLVYLFFLDMDHLRILGMCLGMGYIFHPIEDCFADHGVPILWPIPIKNQLWKRIKTPLTIETGSLANTILDIIILVIDMGLIALIFLTKTT
jgi:hypothetical protein